LDEGLIMLSLNTEVIHTFSLQEASIQTFSKNCRWVSSLGLFILTFAETTSLTENYFLQIVILDLLAMMVPVLTQIKGTNFSFRY